MANFDNTRFLLVLTFDAREVFNKASSANAEALKNAAKEMGAELEPVYADKARRILHKSLVSLSFGRATNEQDTAKLARMTVPGGLLCGFGGGKISI